LTKTLAAAAAAAAAAICEKLVIYLGLGIKKVVRTSMKT
jgi:hypothetical protein